MTYGTIKIDTITFTDGGVDKSVSISGLVQNPTFSGDITVTGTVSGNTIRGQTVSGVTVTGTTALFSTGTFISLTGTTSQGTTATYTSGSFTSLTGVTTSGTTANFVSGVFSTQISGATVTGNAGAFTTLTGGVTTVTSGVFAVGSESNPSISFTSDPNTGIYSPGADQVAISTNSTQRLLIDASGNVNIDSNTLYVDATNNRVGIGTSAPDENLEIRDSIANGGPIIRLRSTDAFANPEDQIGGLEFYNGDLDIPGVAAYIKTLAGPSFGVGGQLVFGTQETWSTGVLRERLRITSAGLVGIGTSSPNGLLDVRSATTWIGDGATDAFLQFNQSATAANRWHIGTGTSNTLIFYKGTYGSGSETARIDSSGRLLVGTSSDSGGALLQVNGDRIRVGTAKTPASATATGTAGEICWDDSYVYVCTAANTWKRSALSTW